VVRRARLGPVSVEYCHGGGDRGVPVVLLHRLGANLRQFVPQHYHLRHRRPALSLSLRGHGRTGVPRRAGPLDFSLSMLARDVSRLIRFLQLSEVHLVGGGLGALVALELLDSTATRVCSLTLWSASVHRDHGSLGSLASRAVRRLLGSRSLSRELLRRTSSHKRVRRRLERMVQEADWAALRGILGQLERYDYRPVLRDRPRPLLWIDTPRSEPGTARQPALTDALRDGRLAGREKLDASGEPVNMDAPARFNDVLDRFLARVEGVPDGKNGIDPAAPERRAWQAWQAGCAHP
jgi:pimeloyl-ACP methyl ester carboxylesterase